MCVFDKLDPLDIAFIAGLAETLSLSNDEPDVQKEPSNDDLLEFYDALSDERDDDTD